MRPPLTAWRQAHVLRFCMMRSTGLPQPMDWKLRKAERPGKGARAARVLLRDLSADPGEKEWGLGQVTSCHFQGGLIINIDQHYVRWVAGVQRGRDGLQDGCTWRGLTQAGEKEGNLDEVKELHCRMG